MSDALLDTLPEEATRRIATGLVDDALEAMTRLDAGEDPEALHDVRVALRRLRSTLRAYSGVLSSKKITKRKKVLAKLTRGTGEGRDAEVQLAWAEQLSSEAREGRAVLVEHLTERKRKGYAAVHDEVLPGLRTLLPKLRDDLRRYRVEHVVFEAAPEHAFRALLGRLLRDEVTALETTLRGVSSIEDEALAHRGRIHGKRIRYLLEPFKDALERGPRAVKALRGLQELLGHLNDLSVRTESLRVALEHTAQERARRLVDDAVKSEAAHRRSSAGALSAPDDGAEARSRAHYERAQAGLLALLRDVLADKQTTFDKLTQEWLNGALLGTLVTELQGLSSTLEVPSAPTEIERKYLLSALPPHVKRTTPSRLDQGYLPGEQLIERIRRIQNADGERYVRTVKLGRGVSRIEVEEACGRDVFDKLWSLTVGRRVEKQRYAVPEGDRVWEIDAFLDRELFLAEIELASEDEVVQFPAWLAPYVVRDVTDEPTYVNSKLAQ
jgi:CHAD domain-containing protein/CYTH domain-containing protein